MRRITCRVPQRSALAVSSSSSGCRGITDRSPIARSEGTPIASSAGVHLTGGHRRGIDGAPWYSLRREHQTQAPHRFSGVTAVDVLDGADSAAAPQPLSTSASPRLETPMRARQEETGRRPPLRPASAPSSPPSQSRQQRPARRTSHGGNRAASPEALLRSLEARNSPYAATLRKRVVPRHTGAHGAVEESHSAHQTEEQRRAAVELRAAEDDSVKRNGFDPALVVRVDSRRRQVRLNDVQRELVWTARQTQYHDVLQRIVACLQSHRSPVEKCQTLYALHDEVIEKRLRLRADTYEDIFHTIYSVGVRRGGGAGQAGKASVSTGAQLVCGDAAWARDWAGQRSALAGTGEALPVELATLTAASSIVLGPHGIEHVWEMYRYLVDSGTNPTPRILQCVMGLLEHASASLAVARSSAASAGAPPSAGGRHRARSSGLLLVEAKAHSLLMDADRFHLTPSEYTLNSYVAVCEACDVMHLAVARVTDYQTRHERQATAGMYARLLTGLVRCGHYEDAMAAMTTMQNVPMTTYLVNAVLQTARHSHDPASVFTFYRAIFFSSPNPLQVAREDETKAHALERLRHRRSSRSRAGLAPSLVTFSVMAQVMLQTQDYTELPFVLAEMRHYGVKGNGMLLNKLLKMMHAARRPAAEVNALRRAMEEKHIRVFDESTAKLSTPALE
ncbi:hypothetical protein NESM_000764500 [Novymonas esmeraldas]|uniref:Uncharacterized protein n=1 Tax=Novymonas esmeraldas TaxID=1808958 RepID=A0AAW0EWG8_9TRYP